MLTPERPPVLPALPAGWRLSRQGGRIVELVLRGRSNRQIAAQVFINENTVEWHLRRVYEEMGVHGRAELVGHFFRETYLPTFRGPDDPGSDGNARITEPPCTLWCTGVDEHSEHT